jgi:hypothetical protein
MNYLVALPKELNKLRPLSCGAIDYHAITFDEEGGFLRSSSSIHSLVRTWRMRLP